MMADGRAAGTRKGRHADLASVLLPFVVNFLRLKCLQSLADPDVFASGPIKRIQPGPPFLLDQIVASTFPASSGYSVTSNTGLPVALRWRR
jgi:hypothetical protein